MAPEQEKRQVPSSYQRLDEIFKNVMPENINCNFSKDMVLGDGSKISMLAFKEWTNEGRGSPLIHSYKVSITPPVSTNKKGDQAFEFTVTEKNTLTVINTPISTLVINSTKIPLSYGERGRDREISQEDSTSAIAGAEAIVDWFSDLMKRGNFTKPPVSFSN